MPTAAEKGGERRDVREGRMSGTALTKKPKAIFRTTVPARTLHTSTPNRDHHAYPVTAGRTVDPA